MSESISVHISSSVFARLQQLAVPLVDDTNSVIARLIDHWEANLPNSKHVVAQASTTAARSAVWCSPRGDTLPVGATLQGEYLGNTFHATVEKSGINFDGVIYDSPSAAGVAAKGKLGRKGRAASTDGRKFWKIQDPSSGRWISIATLHPSIDSDALLAELTNS